MKWREASVNIIIVTEKKTITSTAIIKDGDISGADLEGSHEWTFEKWRIIRWENIKDNKTIKEKD